jgi:UDP-glucuronate 4-epimerase
MREATYTGEVASFFAPPENGEYLLTSTAAPISLAPMVQPTVITGVAGFIGFMTARRLLIEGQPVLGIDVVNDYYDPSLKESRLEILNGFEGFRFERFDLAEGDRLQGLVGELQPDVLIHLAAQAGVRYSLSNPGAYSHSNLEAFVKVLEACRHAQTRHLVYASSSSVYGMNKTYPFRESDVVDHPVSLYAASKKANELMAHCYSHLYGMPTTGLRFFTVYGPWGRPDMALFLFTKAILAGDPIKVFNHGNMKRDFTYIDDIVEGILRVAAKPPSPDPDWDPVHPDPASSSAPYAVFNIGNGNPVQLLDMISALEQELGIEAKKDMLPMQPGDIEATAADVSLLQSAVGYRPNTPLQVGIREFVAWYHSYYACPDHS